MTHSSFLKAKVLVCCTILLVVVIVVVFVFVVIVFVIFEPFVVMVDC